MVSQLTYDLAIQDSTKYSKVRLSGSQGQRSPNTTYFEHVKYLTDEQQTDVINT